MEQRSLTIGLVTIPQSIKLEAYPDWGTCLQLRKAVEEWHGGAVMRQYWKISGLHSDWKIMNGSNDFSVSSDSQKLQWVVIHK